MPSCSGAQSQKAGFAKNQNVVSSTDSQERTLKPEEGKEEEAEEEEEEDEDADFNPFLKETPSQEASSSLSSEVEGLDGNVVNSGISVGAKSANEEKIAAAVDSKRGEEEIILQSSVMVSQSETNQEKHNQLTSATDGDSFTIKELSNSTKTRSPLIDIDNEDAICMRTRARYSLASFTLDELETFLQETDDDDDLQNADDEEEYRKFLTAVLQGGDADGLSHHENENPDDDEDTDADFEIELEELLESDVDENVEVSARKEYDGAGRRPETRQNKRQKVSAEYEKKTLGQVKRPLRPILPNWLNGSLVSGKGLMPEATSNFQSSASGNGLVNGFTPQQIGQLHCMIHEHVQLLIQVFSLSVLEPSQKQIASQVQGLLFEMLHKRDEVLALKRAPYPSICFTPYYACTSVSDRLSKVVQGQYNIDSASTQEGQSVCFPQSNQGSSECSLWVPFVRGPVQSILDVSPLNLVGRYVDDIYSATQELRKRYIESGCDSPVEKKPLFPFSSPFSEAISETSRGTTAGSFNTVSSSPGQQKPKKTLAALLVESTKKQSIALVPKEVAKLSHTFLPLFNPALFPHKPPPAAVVNRVLFTDSEDELLALGIMEYNTDWKAIQQHFLPCKSKHQIFVRQKNRCSSKAPENPIKTVRRMKTSPLTAEEIVCIQEGLKYYKFDWMLVWQYIVPHRDPSLLPRQWRIALGTQKSYKIDASKREKRRLYESTRRKLKAAAMESWQAVSDKEDCEADIPGSQNYMDYSDVPYVHRAFLADWRSDTSILSYSSATGDGNIIHDGISQDNQFSIDFHNYNTSGKTHDQNSNRPAFPYAPNLHQLIHTTSHLRNGMKGAPSATKPKTLGCDVASSSTYYCRPYRSRRGRVNSTHLVKLAPDLPPVNLPPSVRVVSQTAFKGFPLGGGVTPCRKDNSASQISHGEKVGTNNQVKGARAVMKDSVRGSQVERSGTVEGRSIMAEKGSSTSTDLQMHPLFFQATEDVNVPHHRSKFSSGTSSPFSLFSGTQQQLNLSLLHSSQLQSHTDCSNKSGKSRDSIVRSGGIDFHPLLQKWNDTQLPTSFDAIQAGELVNSDVPDTANRSPGLNDKSNELDLEIHLSSVSGREKSVKTRPLKAHDPTVSKKTVPVCGTAMIPQENSNLYSQKGSKIPSVSSCELASSSLPLVVPSDNISRYDIDDIGDQSHPGIVMEQEELSDSEEDIEEHVEFECEEMADSDGEDGSGCEQAPEVPNKVVPTSEENVTSYACDPRVDFDTQVCRNDGNDGKSNSSWLTLDSFTEDDPVLPKTNTEGDTIGEVSAFKIFTVCKVVTEERNTMNMVQQQNTGPLAFATPRKPRKLCGKLNANLNIRLTAGRSSNGGNQS